MRIDLNKQEISKILTDKYGDATFRLFYVETDQEYESRTNRLIINMAECPDKLTYTLYFGDK